ncbi:MAG: DUF2304 domain-containing protein [Lachnospiraceae bacterium]|nr:DUF2304 domain-containing protein [Lachnospiraceae bacterium]MCH5261450.1 DUF2304 domain-containing protein [Lachnospiraceae bacterium]
MIPRTLQITLSVAVICYFILILFYLKKKMLELKYTLLWLVAGVVMGIMIFFPETLVWFARLLGIESNMNGLYVLCIAFIIMILMTLTSIVSRQQMKIRTLTQEFSMLEKRIRELEEQQDSGGKSRESD